MSASWVKQDFKDNLAATADTRSPKSTTAFSPGVTGRLVSRTFDGVAVTLKMHLRPPVRFRLSESFASHSHSTFARRLQNTSVHENPSSCPIVARSVLVPKLFAVDDVK